MILGSIKVQVRVWGSRVRIRGIEASPYGKWMRWANKGPQCLCQACVRDAHAPHEDVSSRVEVGLGLKLRNLFGAEIDEKRW